MLQNEAISRESLKIIRFPNITKSHSISVLLSSAAGAAEGW